MAADKKNRIKRVVLSWLCVAAIFSGNLPGTIRVISTSVTAAAASYDAIIDLSDLSPLTTPGEYYDVYINSAGVYTISILQGGHFELTGSCNDMVQFNIEVAPDSEVILDCNDAYFRSVPGDVIFSVSSVSALILSGKLSVEPNLESGTGSSVFKQGNVSADYSTVTYQDSTGAVIGESYYLNGTPYSDKRNITSGKCAYTEDRAGNKTAVPTTITADTTVICGDHELDETGTCTVCGAEYGIDLTKLADYVSAGGNILDGKVSVSLKLSDELARPIGSYYRIDINESGTYLLTGDNNINGSYVDVNFHIGDNVDANIICDKAYIKNVIMKDFTPSGEEAAVPHGYVNVFQTTNTNSTLNLSGTLAIERTYCNSHDTFSDYLGGNTSSITADFFEVTYTDADGNSLGKTAYLSGGTYSDKSEVPSQYPCVTSNGAVFDYTDIKAAATVICSDHSIDENGVCNNCSQNLLIDLSKLSDYLSDPSALPDGVTIKNPDNFDDIVEITITKSGNYMLKGKNYCNGAYFDVKFNIENNADVTFECNDVFIKNDNVGCMINTTQYLPTFPEGVTVNNVYSYDDNLDYSGNYTAFNYVTPFNITNGAKLTLNGKLFVDTARAVVEDGASFDLPVTEGGGNLATGLSNVYYCDSANNNNRIDENYCLYGANYIATDYIDSKYHCVKVGYNDPDDYSFNGGNNIYLALHHHIPDDSNTCDYCGQTFGTIYTVTIGDETKRVAAGDTIDPPADPAADVGKKFDGWYDENGNKFDFTKPVTKNVVLSAKFSDSPVKSVATVTPPTNSINYIEGNKFDPTGLKIEVTYDDGRSEEITYDPANTLFKFSPALGTALTPADTKITVTYGEKAEDGSNTLDIPITVAAKQVTSVAIKSAPTKTSYIEGNSFDPTGLVITLTYDNGDTVDVAYNDAPNDFTFDKDVLALGDTTVQITYGGKSVEQEIIVAEKSIVSASIKTVPQKTTYKVGEDIDVTGGTLILTYDNNSTKEIPITAAMLTYDNTKAGKATVTVTYGAFKDTFEVEFEKVTVDPTDPPKPTEPTKPSKPTEPTEPTKPTTNEPQIKGNDGKMGWDAILGEIDDAKDGDTVTVDMNGTTKLPKDIVNDLMGKDIDLVLDMGNGIVWTINGLTITNPIDVDMGVTIGSGIPVKVINAVTGECSYITITLAHNGEFGFVPVLTIEMNEKDIGYYANLYYYNETENSTEFINSGLIGKDGKVNLAFTHASEYVIVIDDHDHGKAADGSSDSDTNPSTGVTMVFGAALVSSAAMIISRKRRK